MYPTLTEREAIRAGAAGVTPLAHHVGQTGALPSHLVTGAEARALNGALTGWGPGRTKHMYYGCHVHNMYSTSLHYYFPMPADNSIQRVLSWRGSAGRLTRAAGVAEEPGRTLVT